MKIFYEGTKCCKKCNRDLPNNSYYYPVDKACKTGLRNVCRECNPKYKKFLLDDSKDRNRWTEDELRILELNYKKMSNDDLIKLYFPNRSKRALESVAFKYGFNHKYEDVLNSIRQKSASKLPQCQKGRFFSPETRINMSMSQKNRYKDIEQREIARQNAIKRGTWKGCLHPIHLNPLYGEKNGRWKGGISDLSVQLRRGIIEWKNLSANFCDYKCILTGNRFQNIHHVISFDSILHTALTKLGVDKKNKVSEYTSEDYDLLRNEIIRLHSDTLYGACLCKELHELFHKEYTYYNSTINDFIGFIELLTQGDYENYLNQNNLKLNMNKKYINYLLSNHIL